MISKIIHHIYIIFTILFTVYSQVIMRWQISKAGQLPDDLAGRFYFICGLFTNLWVLSGILATLFAGVSWMLVMTKFQISYAYPWISLNFLLMFLLGVWLFNETFNLHKLVATLFILVGIILMARS